MHAILGNHDWWEDRTAQKNGGGPVFGRLALERVGIRVYENDVTKIRKDGQTFWLAGLGDQLALLPRKQWGRKTWQGVDDLPATLAKIDDASPVVLLAHEPDIFPHVPERVGLTLCGHTHGGQVRLFGYSPVVPSRFGNRYAYGHVVDGSRNLIVSGGPRLRYRARSVRSSPRDSSDRDRIAVRAGCYLTCAHARCGLPSRPSPQTAGRVSSYGARANCHQAKARAARGSRPGATSTPNDWRAPETLTLLTGSTKLTIDISATAPIHSAASAASS